MKPLSLIGIWTPKTYDRLAKSYDFFDRLSPQSNRAKEKIVGALVEEIGSGSILDIACGTGNLLLKAHSRGFKCYGNDLSQGMLDQTQGKVPEVTLTKGSFTDLPYPNNYFDAVVATNAISAVGYDVEKVLGEMVRVCKPGGSIWLAEFGYPQKENWRTRIVIRVAILLGDCPYDFEAIFRKMGYKPDIEHLAMRGMYQLIHVRK
jgi:demethylmenaquinone methyltransferase/2-methoxy-6-polyprenyl-1,4-benzoquinol methylase